MSILEIHSLAVMSDNYVHLARCPETGDCAVVDPGVADAVIAALKSRGWQATHILNTHHHNDHVGGNQAIKAAFPGCRIIGAAADRNRIPGLDETVGEGDTVAVGQAQGSVIEVPGHTSGHIAFHFAASNALFCGDTLFVMGCGRLFEGTAAQMWASLKKLRALPDDTRVFCAHEYTLANAQFACAVEPDNADLLRRLADVQALRDNGQPTVPSTMADEKRTNPFLRCDVPEFLDRAGLAGQDAASAFADVRRRKDMF